MWGKKYKVTLIAVLLMITIAFIIYSIYKSNTAEGKFGIYLLEDSSITEDDVLDLDLTRLDVKKQPLIGVKDLNSYNWTEHSFILTKNAKKRIIERDDLHRKPFVVVVNKNNIYVGLFTYEVSSISFSNPVIILGEDKLNKIERSYGGIKSLRDNDPRDNKDIKRILMEYGKLVE